MFRRPISGSCIPGVDDSSRRFAEMAEAKFPLRMEQTLHFKGEGGSHVQHEKGTLRRHYGFAQTEEQIKDLHSKEPLII